MATSLRSAAVLGAGMAGLACALALAEAGVAVTVLDKGRRPGGRVATRRIDGMAFDHGAQYATGRDPAFVAILDGLAAEGRAAHWPQASDGHAAPWVGTPGMSALADGLALRLPAAVLTQRQAAFLHPGDDGWRVRHRPADAIAPGEVAGVGGAVAGPFDAVLLAIPAPQAATLLATARHRFVQEAAQARYEPCWAAMVAFAQAVAAEPVQRCKSGPIAWAAREASRPGRDPAGMPDAWVLHASADWSGEHLERDADDIAHELGGSFASAHAAPGPLHRSARRWRFARVATPLGQDCLWDGPARLGACGDWCIGGRVEAAWLSGRALARRALGST